jgi:hypothetical protein
MLAIVRCEMEREIGTGEKTSRPKYELEDLIAEMPGQLPRPEKDGA